MWDKSYPRDNKNIYSRLANDLFWNCVYDQSKIGLWSSFLIFLFRLKKNKAYFINWVVVIFALISCLWICLLLKAFWRIVTIYLCSVCTYVQCLCVHKYACIVYKYMCRSKVDIKCFFLISLHLILKYFAVGGRFSSPTTWVLYDQT